MMSINPKSLNHKSEFGLYICENGNPGRYYSAILRGGPKSLEQKLLSRSYGMIRLVLFLQF